MQLLAKTISKKQKTLEITMYKLEKRNTTEKIILTKNVQQKQAKRINRIGRSLIE